MNKFEKEKYKTEKTDQPRRRLKLAPMEIRREYREYKIRIPGEYLNRFTWKYEKLAVRFTKYRDKLLKIAGIKIY